MVTFNFSFSPPKKKREIKPKEEVIVPNATGIVVANKDGVLLCNYKSELYRFTPKSFDTDKRKNVYMRVHDKYGHRIKIIRDKENRNRLNCKHYAALAEGLIVKGKIIKTCAGLILFHAITCYNPADVVEMAQSIKEYNNYEENEETKII